MTYVPQPQAQFVPRTASSPDDCVPATCAIAADRATVGAVHVNHAVIRAATGQARGGVPYPAAVLATSTATGVVGQVRYGISPSDLKALLAGGRACTVSIDTHATANTPYRTNAFLGGHSVFANRYYSSTDAVAVEDPGTTQVGFLNWPFSLLVKAALLRTGNHGINVIVWPDTEGVTWLAKQARSVHPKPTYAASAGKPFAVTRPGTAYVGGSTTNGETYTLHSGGTANGWVQVKVAGKWGWVTGDCFR